MLSDADRQTAAQFLLIAEKKKEKGHSGKDDHLARAE